MIHIGNMIYIYMGNNLIIFNQHLNNPPRFDGPVNQLEFPLAGLPWLVDSIENKFWKKPEEGGLDGVFHVLATMEGELLRIGRMAHAGAENVPGFNLSNHGRGGYIDETSPQHHAIADAIMKEGGLFERLKKLSERVRAGEFGP